MEINKKELNLDQLDEIAFSLFKQKELKNDIDYTISIKEKKEETTVVLLEEPFYSDKEWNTIRILITVNKDNTIIDKKRITREEKYSFADLTDEEYQKRRVYNFVEANNTLYIERKQALIKGKRKIESTNVTFDLKNKVVNSLYKRENLLSEVLPVAKYKEAFSRPSIGLGYGDNFDYYDDDTFTL